MKRILTIGLRWIIVITYAGIIFYLSSVSQPVIGPGFLFFLPEGADKVIHFFEYAVFCFLICRAVDVSMGGALASPSYASANALFLCFLCASLYGLSDEIHQLFTTFRNCDVLDFAADTAGAAAVAMLWPFVTTRLTFLRN
jgi:VanZ family protein